MDCKNYKQMKSTLRGYLSGWEFNVPTIKLYALVNNEYVMFKEYRYYICECVKVNSTSIYDDKVAKYEIYTTTKEKAIDNAFKLYRKTYDMNPTYIVSE